MTPDWKNVNSLEKPELIDKKSCPSGVYVRRNIIFAEDTYTYEECFFNHEDYAAWNIAKFVTGEDDSEAYQNYKLKLDTAVEYTNGHLYKPKWAEVIYAGLLQKGAMIPDLFPLKIWDATDIEENVVEMTIVELTDLTIFLAKKQEEFFHEFKREKLV